MAMRTRSKKPSGTRKIDRFWLELSFTISSAVWPPISPKILAKEFRMQPQRKTGVKVTESGSRSFLEGTKTWITFTISEMMHVRTCGRWNTDIPRLTASRPGIGNHSCFGYMQVQLPVILHGISFRWKLREKRSKIAGQCVFFYVIIPFSTFLSAFRTAVRRQRWRLGGLQWEVVKIAKYVAIQMRLIIYLCFLVLFFCVMYK